VTAVLEFIHARKWLVELLLLAAIVGAVWWFCHHLIDVGVQRERAAWMLKVDEANLKAAEAKGRADAAEAAGKKEHDELAKYVADHPLHGSLASLCRKPSSVPAATTSNPGNARASTGPADVQPLPEGDPGGDVGEPDQLGMLSALAARADILSGSLREWQAR
jgi:hypothetical protein